MKEMITPAEMAATRTVLLLPPGGSEATVGGSGTGVTTGTGFITRENSAGMTCLSWPGYCQAMAKLSLPSPSFTRAYMGKKIVNHHEKGPYRIYIWKRHMIILRYTESHLIVICLPSNKKNR
jgi:hypothetical protein